MTDSVAATSPVTAGSKAELLAPIPEDFKQMLVAVAQVRGEWDLDSATTYLNHGSFGPSPREVRVARAAWTERLERQPMKFYCREMDDLLDQTSAKLAEFLSTKPERIALVDNATVAMNIVAESMDLSADDEILLTDHEYGAVRNIWMKRCQVTGARIVTAELPYPPTDHEVVAAIANHITPKTRLIVVSHVTSATACILPVKDICAVARQQRVPVCIDGPHAIAMLDVGLDDIGCDYYCASGHKWLCGPFGSGFLWVHPRHFGRIRCPMVSWGGSISGRSASWKDRTNWLGTRDPAPLLAMSAAVDFFTPDRLALFRRYSHELVSLARRELLLIEGTGPFCTPDESNFVSMCGVELPQPEGWKPGYHGHPDPLQLRLRDEYGIELLTGSWNGHRFLRVSAHLYNTIDQIQYFVSSLKASL